MNESNWETYRNNDMPRQCVDMGLLRGQSQRLLQRGEESGAIALHLLDHRQVLVAAALGQLVDGQLVGGGAVDVEKAARSLLLRLLLRYWVCRGLGGWGNGGGGF